MPNSPFEVHVVFEVAGVRWAAPVSQVREVLPWTQPLPLPGAPAGVIGVVKLRGDTLPVLTMPGLETAAPTRSAPLPGTGRLLLVEVGGRRLALAADAVITVVRVIPGEGDAVPSGTDRGVTALVEVDERPTLTVDLGVMLAGTASLSPA
jgi:purine-binding chemotaxis protein CheW